MNSRLRRFAFAGVFLCTATVLPAFGSSLWNWNYSAPGIHAAGTFTTVDQADKNGGYLITAIAGTRNGQKITGLQPTGTWIPGNAPYAVDNLVYRGPGPQLTKNGFGFAIADGTYSNPFYADFLPSPVYLEFYSIPASGSSTEVPVVFSAKPVPTPEPATTGFLLAGLAIFAGIGHKVSWKCLKPPKNSRAGR